MLRRSRAVVPLVLIAAAAGLGMTRSAAIPAFQAGSGQDTIVKGRVTQIVILPMPVPAAVRPYDMRACFDVDTTGNARLLSWTRTADSTYDARVAETLRGYRFRPSRWSSGAAIRDTICVRAVADT